MPLFHYQAFDSTGTLRKGSQDADTESELRQILRSRDLFLKDIRIARSFRKKKKERDLFAWLPKRTNYNKVLTVFTRQFEVLIDATIPYDKALQLIIKQTEDVSFQEILSEVRGKVVEGGSLADAMQKHPEVFPSMYTSMVRSGENGGTLGMIMQRLANYYESQDRLRNKLMSAMIYPAFMAVFSVSVVGFMITYIVPKITQIFESQDAILPLPTQILIVISDFMVDQWYWVIAGILAIFLFITTFSRTNKGKRIRQKMEISLPFVGALSIKIMVARFCQTLGTLLKSGVDLKTSLEIAKHVVVNQFFIERLEQLIVDVNNKGVPLSVAMAKTNYFPEYVRHIVAIGEEAARVDELLEKTAERMQEEVSRLLEGLTALLQPAMIIIMGGLVGFIALSILLPMMNMNQLLSQ